MRFRYFSFFIIFATVKCFTCYYAIVFSIVYRHSQLGWIYAGIASLILDLFGIMHFLPFIGSLMRFLAQKIKIFKFLIYWTKIDEFNFYFYN